MNTKLQTQINTLETARKKLLSTLKQYPDEILNKKPAQDKWSVVQVAKHLMESESVSLQYLQKKTLDTSRSKSAGVSGEWKMLVVHLSFIAPIKFKAPKMLDPDVSAMSLHEIEAQWDKIRKDTFELIGKLSDAELKKELWKHAIAGKMNIYQMLAFINIHVNRHVQQIERTLREVAKNK